MIIYSEIYNDCINNILTNNQTICFKNNTTKIYMENGLSSRLYTKPIK